MMKRSLWIILVGLILSGCSSISDTLFGEDLTSAKLILDIQAAPNINPNANGEPSPVELRVYQLADSQAFTQADFLQIFNDAQGALKAELLLTRQLPSILPGESRKEVLPLSAEAKYVGVIAGFSQYREAKNKVIYKPIISKAATMSIELDGINLTLTGETESSWFDLFSF